MMDLTLNKVIDIQLVQSNEVGNSVRMEKEGFERSLSFLEGKGVVVKAIVTDRHTGVQKFLREQRPGISHYFDPWHMGKGIGKKIDAMAKMRRTQEVGPWRKSVVNHLYWSASTSASGQEVLAKWASIANHLQNVHTHENPLFPSCLHQPLVEEQARHWLKPSTAACEQLTAVLLAPRLLKDMEKISPQHHTSAIESFHSLILKFAPKNVVFSFTGMLCRLQLTAMHYNENAQRVHASTTAGELRYSIVYLKYKRGDFTVRPIRGHPTSGYVETLTELLFNNVVKDPGAYQDFLDTVLVPEKLCSQYTRPDKREAVARHKSRFFKNMHQ
ncbi:uncharacterized protein LOC115567468 [Sparus aurata]|uniref:uncharacterized protein LOC115567468 n=1 Tax=Sparus aurata TaxID=8175 RepID=UPI0011C146FD|nr:uncharacterized protein LOC115567468 [Sparus aurata]